MTQDEIIRMAREAGFAEGVAEIVGLEGFERFAALVAAHEREKQAEHEPIGEMINHVWNENMVVPSIKQSLPVGTKLYTAPQPVKQEPVAWIYRGILHSIDPSDWAEGEVTPLYAAPVRTKDLTDDEIWREYLGVPTGKRFWLDFARAVIAADREKNK